jgi:hypothetical protein
MGEVAQALVRFLARSGRGDPIVDVLSFLDAALGDARTQAPDLSPSPVVIHGLQQEAAPCRRCNAHNAEGARFCSSCGEQLSAETVPADPMAEITDAVGDRPVPPEFLANAVSLGPLVGRSGELAGSRALLASAARGRASAALFVAPHGGGKSRFLDAVESVASLQGYLVLRGAGHPRGGSIWRSILAGLAAVMWEDAGSDVPSGSAERDEIFLQLGLRPDDVAALAIVHQDRDPDVDPALIERILRGYLHATEDESICLMIEDAQWLTANETVAVQSVLGIMKDTRLSVLASAIDQSLPALSFLRQVKLEPLTEREQTQLAEMLLEGPVPPSIKETLARAEGNPGLLRLWLSSMIDGRVLVRLDGEWLSISSGQRQLHLERNIRDYYRRLYLGLSAPARAFVEAGATLGRPFARTELQSPEPERAEEECLASGLIVRNGTKLVVAGGAALAAVFEEVTTPSSPALPKTAEPGSRTG